MKKDTIGILCCPTCKGSMKLTIKKEEGDEIITGILNCSKCKTDYCIEEGIADLLPK